jgi:inosose dehydratase
MFELAVDVGAQIVHVIPGAHASLEPLYHSLEETREAASKKGLVLALEAIVNQVICTADGLQAAIDKVPGLRVNFDPSHLQVTEGGVVASAHRLGRLVSHVHLKDAKGTPASFTFPPLGQGDVDLAAMLRALLEEGYGGVVSVEDESGWFGGVARPPLQLLADNKAFVDELLETVGGPVRASRKESGA